LSAASDHAALIVARALTKRFGTFVAVDHVDFTIAAGEIMGFIGPNGAGKSTIIRMLCGLLRPSEGQIIIAGVDVAREPEEARQHIGYMSQKFSLYGDLSVSENLRFFGGIYRVPPAKLAERMRYAIDMAGLTGREDDLVSALAGGWKQRLALGCAILHSPPILFLDEPTSGVDPISRRRFWDLIHDLAATGVAILVTTHYMDEAEYCDRVMLINQGRVVASGSPSELKHTPLGGKMLLIESPSIGKALHILPAAKGVRDVAAFGDALHVLADDGLDDGTVRKVLEGAGINDARISVITPGLEDVFVNLVTRPRQSAAAP
jgi:ABC-2 type transport system ATP-binding protein